MQVTNHIEGQRTRLPHHFVNSRPLPDDSNQSVEVFTGLLQTELDGLNRIGLINRVVPAADLMNEARALAARAKEAQKT